MNLKIIGQLAGIAVLTAGLAGCMDITSEIEILSETTGRVTTTSVMGAEFYAMAKAGMDAADEGGGADGFCNEEGAVLTENPDGSATCIVVVEGTFAELAEDGENGPVYEVVSPGVVKVSFSTASLQDELGADDETDEQTKAMMAAFFEGHAITLRIGGGRIVDTNMTRSGDSMSAEVVIPFLDLLNDTLDLPDTLHATVDTN